MLVQGDRNGSSIRMLIVFVGPCIYGVRDLDHGLYGCNKKDFYHGESDLRNVSFLDSVG